MEQQFLLLNYLLLLPIEPESREFISATIASLTTSPSSLATFCLLKMGSCVGSLLTKQPTTAAACLWRQATDDQEAELVEDSEEDGEKPTKQKFIYRIIKFKRKTQRKQFLERFWQRQETNYSQLGNKSGNSDNNSEIQLQNLDVNSLLNSNTLAAAESVINAAATNAQFSSRTSSSLDLEWEHEYGSHLRPYPPTLLPPTTTPMKNPHSSRVTKAALFAPTQRNPLESALDPQWQFLSQCRYFDEEPVVNSPSSHERSLTATTTAEAARASTETTSSCTATELEQEHLRRLASTTQAKLYSLPKQQQHLFGPTLRPSMGATTFTRTSSRTSCSRISTPESLEWDIDEEQQRQMRLEDDNLGLETLQLLHQIDQLKNKVLKETGEGLFDASDDFSRVCGEHLEEIDIS